MRDFLKSASEILAEDGEIHVALCEKQGGTTCSSMVEWRQSWMAVEFAAECGLLLLDVSPFLVSGFCFLYKKDLFLARLIFCLQ